MAKPNSQLELMKRIRLPMPRPRQVHHDRKRQLLRRDRHRSSWDE